jgi:hypothetical protein
MLCESHIVTKLFWERSGIIGKGKSFRLKNIGEPPFGHFHQDGPKEYLLCEACEQKFEKWEDYAEELLYRSREKIVQRTHQSFGVPNTEYSRFKLFVMSLFWRMAETTQPFYETVAKNIGARNRERLRRMLLAEDAGEPVRYGFILSVVRINGNFAQGVMSPAKCLKQKGMNAYAVIISGIHYTIFVSPPSDSSAKSHMLKRNGILQFQVKEYSDFPHFKSEFADAEERAREKASRTN